MDDLYYLVDPEARLVSEIVIHPFGRSATESDWAHERILLFDDAVLTPNSKWEDVNNSYVVSLCKQLISQRAYGLHNYLNRDFTFLRDTREHRNEALTRHFDLCYIKRVYRFTAEEVKSTAMSFPKLFQVGVIEAKYRAKQLQIWQRFRLHLRNGVLFPTHPCDMYVVIDSATDVAAFLLFNINSNQVGPVCASDSVSLWSLFNTLVKMRLYDDDQCLVVCLALLSQRILDSAMQSNGSFLYSISVASHLKVEIID